MMLPWNRCLLEVLKLLCLWPFPLQYNAHFQAPNFVYGYEESTLIIHVQF